jgi:hypothetical protein
MERFTQHIQAQKEKLIDSLSGLSSEQSSPLIEKYSKLLDDQIEIYSKNFDLYQDELNKIFTPEGGKELKKVTLDELHTEHNECQNFGELNEFVMKYLLLRDETQKFGGKSETELLLFSKGLFSQFEIALEVKPTLVIPKNIDELIAASRKDQEFITFESPAERFDNMTNSTLINSQELQELLKFALPDFKGKVTLKLVERATREAKNLVNIIKKFDPSKKHLIISKSDKGRRRGAITDLNNTSNNKVFDLEKKLVMDNQNPGPTEVGFYFVGEFLIFVTDNEGKPADMMMSMLEQKGMKIDFKGHLGLVGSPIEFGKNEPKTQEDLDKVFWHFDHLELLEMIIA